MRARLGSMHPALATAPRPARAPARAPIGVIAFALALGWTANFATGCSGAQGTSATGQPGGGAETPAHAFISPTAYEAFLQAELAASAGDYAAAARQLDLATLADPRDPFLPARRAEVLVLSGDLESALDAAEQTARDFPDRAESWIALGEVRTRRGDPSGAADAFNRAIALSGDDPTLREAIDRAQSGSTEMALGPHVAAAPTRPSRRRERADQAFRARDYRAVDRWLASLVSAGTATVADRVRLIEARARDGRGAEAAGLVAGVPVGHAPEGVSAAEHARLWLLAGRPSAALDEAERALAADDHDVLARLVAGEAHLRAGHTPRGITLLAGVPPDASGFVEAQIAAANALDSAGRSDVADLVLARGVTRLPAGDGAGRDRLRLARAEALLRRASGGDARAVLATVETPSGRQRRGAMLADNAAPAEALNDLRARTGDAYDDASADAWIALLCTLHGEACSAGERDRALASASAGAPAAAETLRARALAETDRARAGELLHRAEASDPLSVWNGRVMGMLGAADRTNRGQ